MMLGTVPTSVPQFILLGNWILEGNFKLKWSKLKGNRLFWILSSVLLIHVTGLFYTEDLHAGWDDVRTKIPLMFLPMIFLSTDPLTKNEFRWVMYGFIAGSIINITWCHIYSFVLHKNETVRNASRFMSHIRLGLYLNLAIACCLHLIYSTRKVRFTLFATVIILYFLYTMYALGLASGVVNFMLLSLVILCWLIWQSKPVIKWTAFMIVAVTICGVAIYFVRVYKKQNEENSAYRRNEFSLNGRKYFHFENSYQKENGNPVHDNIQFEELKKEWNLKCPDDSISFNPKHNLERYQVLIRYLSSKGLNKDSVGIASLNETDIQNIRNNIPNYLIPEWSFFHRRIYELVNDLSELGHGNENGHSITMRLYFWKAGLLSIQGSPVIGCGTGDVQTSMNQSYESLQSALSEEWHKRPHNQFMTITVALGFIGLIVFLVSLIWPVIHLRKIIHPVYYAFFVLAIVSFMVEDTLETQAGLTFFAFFNTLFLTAAYHEKSADQNAMQS